MPLFFRCKSCEGEHLSPIVFPDRGTFEGMSFAKNAFECPRTNAIAWYEKGDLYWKVDLPTLPPTAQLDSHLSVQQTSLEAARVLIVDDERPTVSLLEALLRRAGFRELASATDPREALTLFDSFHPDLLLLDIQMPHLDGFGVLAAIRARNTEGDPVPILVLSGDIDPPAKLRALSEGAKDFLSKPFDHVEALLRIKNLLETRFLQVRLQQHVEMLERILLDRRNVDEAARQAETPPSVDVAPPGLEAEPPGVEADRPAARVDTSSVVTLPRETPGETAWVIRF